MSRSQKENCGQFALVYIYSKRKKIVIPISDILNFKLDTYSEKQRKYRVKFDNLLWDAYLLEIGGKF